MNYIDYSDGFNSTACVEDLSFGFGVNNGI